MKCNVLVALAALSSLSANADRVYTDPTVIGAALHQPCASKLLNHKDHQIKIALGYRIVVLRVYSASDDVAPKAYFAQYSDSDRNDSAAGESGIGVQCD